MENKVAPNIHTYFRFGLDHANEEICRSMTKLRQTWSELIEPEKLLVIDSHIRDFQASRLRHTRERRKRPLEDKDDSEPKKIRRMGTASDTSSAVSVGKVRPKLVARRRILIPIEVNEVLVPPPTDVQELFGKLVMAGLVPPPTEQVDVDLIKLVGKNRQINENDLRSNNKQNMQNAWSFPKEQWEINVEAKFQLKMETDEEVVPCATSDPSAPVTFCGVCGDQFDEFFDDDDDEWKLRNAIRYNKLFYHPICLEDL